MFGGGGPLDDERKGHSRPEVYNLGCFRFSCVGEWPCVANAERRSRDKALAMVVNVAGGVD